MARKRKLTRRGNFRQVAPLFASRHLKDWAKVKDASGNPVKYASQITVGIRKGLKTPADVAKAKIRFQEAVDAVKYFEFRVAEFENKLASFKRDMSVYKACVKSGSGAACLKPKRPSKPDPRSKAADSRRAGNFRPMTKSRARSYLRRILGNIDLRTPALRPDTSGNIPADISSPFVYGPRGSIKNFLPRIKECVEVLGLPEALKIAQNAKERSLKRALAKKDKLAPRIAKAVGDKLVKLQAEKAKLETFLATAARRKLRRRRK